MRSGCDKAERGFSLVELIAVLAISSVLAAIAVSMGSEPIYKTQRTQFLRRWQSAVQVARHEAMRRGQPVALAALPVTSRNGGPGTGIMVFVDTNANGVYDGTFTGSDPTQIWSQASGEPIAWAYVAPDSSTLTATYSAANYWAQPTVGGMVLFNYLDPMYFTPLGQPTISWRYDTFYNAGSQPMLWTPMMTEWIVSLSDSRIADGANQNYASLTISRIGAVRATWN